MEIKKIAGLSEEEVEKLKAAGGVLKAIAEAKANGEIDELDDSAKSLINAIIQVSTAAAN